MEEAAVVEEEDDKEEVLAQKKVEKKKGVGYGGESSKNSTWNASQYIENKK